MSKNVHLLIEKYL